MPVVTQLMLFSSLAQKTLQLTCLLEKQAGHLDRSGSLDAKSESSCSLGFFWWPHYPLDLTPADKKKTRINSQQFSPQMEVGISDHVYDGYTVFFFFFTKSGILSRTLMRAGSLILLWDRSRTLMDGQCDSSSMSHTFSSVLWEICSVDSSLKQAEKNKGELYEWL